MSESDARRVALYDGREFLGTISVIGDQYHARLADRRDLGPFPTLQAAKEGISAASGRPVGLLGA
jgi:hypothetical protein